MVSNMGLTIQLGTTGWHLLFSYIYSSASINWISIFTRGPPSKCNWASFGPVLSSNWACFAVKTWQPRFWSRLWGSGWQMIYIFGTRCDYSVFSATFSQYILSSAPIQAAPVPVCMLKRTTNGPICCSQFTNVALNLLAAKMVTMSFMNRAVHTNWADL